MKYLRFDIKEVMKVTLQAFSLRQLHYQVVWYLITRVTNYSLLLAQNFKVDL